MNETPKDKGMYKIQLFDYVKAINDTKEDIEDMSQYSPFVVNKAFSYYPDTVFIVNELNMCQNVPEKSQFYYLINSIAKAKRYSKWIKKDKHEDFEAVSKYFGYSIEKTKNIMKILNKKQIELIKKKIKEIQNE